MRKQVALLSAVSILLSASLFAGIFNAPKANAEYNGDVEQTDFSSVGYLPKKLPINTIDLTSCGVIADDGKDDTAALQAAIDSLRGTAGAENPYILMLPKGEIIISDEIHVDVSGITIKGHGSDPQTGSKVTFKPSAEVAYASMSGEGEQEPEIDGKMWPGFAAFHVETREKHPQEQAYEGSINFHWKTGVKLGENGAHKGDTTITLYKNTAGQFTVGGDVLIRSANTQEFFDEAGIPTQYQTLDEHMRTQMFKVTAVDILNNTITLDKPLEFDVPFVNSANYNSKVVPLTSITDVGFEDFYFTQTLEHTKYADTVNPLEYNALTNPGGVKNRYENAAYEYAIHGILFKYAVNCYVHNVSMYMAGSHPIVTEFARNLTISDNKIDGSWNKGKGGHGYIRLSKLNDSLVENNLIQNVRHLALQWASSGNIVRGNDLTCDINLHGGWERNNYIIFNTSHLVYEHRSWANGKPEEGTWYPIFWSSAQQASKWAGPSGFNNVLFGNTFYKQETPGGEMKLWSMYSSNSVIQHMGWDGKAWRHLQLGGKELTAWSGNETKDYTHPNGVFTQTFSAPPSAALSASVAEVEAGKTLKLRLQASVGTVCEPLIEWSSSDLNIAQVAGGRVVGLTPGTAVISAKYPGLQETFTCKVTVLPSSDSGEKRVEISAEHLDLEVKVKSVIQILSGGVPVPYSEITWSSSVWFVQIDKYGVITPNSTGEAVITGVYKGQTYTCTVTVYKAGELPPDTPDEDFSFVGIESDKSGIQKPGITQTFTCTVKGGKNNRFVYYILKNGQICYTSKSFVSQPDFSFTPQEKGAYKIVAYCYNSSGESISYQKELIIQNN